MGFLDWFRNTKIAKKFSSWREFGNYNSRFTTFGTDVYKSDVVRSCVRPIAEHTSKANARCSNKELEYLLNMSPNMYMTGKDFLAKVRTRLEIQNTCFIMIARDERLKVVGLYPIPYTSFDALECSGGLYIQFHLRNHDDMTFPWEDLIVLRKDYNNSDIAGDDNTAILGMLDLIDTTNQGIANAVKATANLRGILKSTKAMLSNDDIKKQKEAFVKDYLNLENEGGIASLDATQDFMPITMNPTITNYAQMKEFRENVERYFGVNNSIITSDYTESQMEAFYESRIEPFLVALSTEMTRKIFTKRELGFNNYIIYESNRMQYASTNTKLQMVQLVDRGALTPNEWRMMFNLAPVEGGDVPIRRLDTAVVDDTPKLEEGEEPNAN